MRPLLAFVVSAQSLSDPATIVAAFVVVALVAVSAALLFLAFGIEDRETGDTTGEDGDTEAPENDLGDAEAGAS